MPNCRVLDRRLLLGFAACLVLSALAVEPSADERQMHRRRLELLMTDTRLRLLREDAELRELNERIQGLQRLLARKLEAHPDLQGLQRQLQPLETP